MHLSFLLLALILSASRGIDDSTAQGQQSNINSIDEIINDMELPHEAIAQLEYVTRDWRAYKMRTHVDSDMCINAPP